MEPESSNNSEKSQQQETLDAIAKHQAMQGISDGKKPEDKMNMNDNSDKSGGSGTAGAKRRPTKRRPTTGASSSAASLRGSVTSSGEPASEEMKDDSQQNHQELMDTLAKHHSADNLMAMDESDSDDDGDNEEVGAGAGVAKGGAPSKKFNRAVAGAYSVGNNLKVISANDTENRQESASAGVVEYDEELGKEVKDQDVKEPAPQDEILLEATLVLDPSETANHADLKMNGAAAPMDDLSVYMAEPAQPVEDKTNAEVKQNLNRKWALVLCAIVLGVVGITVGSFCGTGACSSESDSSSHDQLEDAPNTTSTSTNPTMAPSKEAQTWAPGAMPDLVLTGLPDHTLLALQDPTSAQSVAHQWVANDPYLQDYDNERRLQRFALATFYTSTGGDKWRDNQGWLSYEQDECTWFNRVDFQWYPEYNSSEPCYENTTTYRYLTPWDNRLVGKIPPEIELLTSLINLDLSTSSLEGTIPTEIGGLTQLRKFFMNNNEEMTGTIPSEIGLLTHLDTLSMHDTGLTGTLATELGRLTSLIDFWFEFTDVTGSIPSELCDLSDASLWVAYSQVECPVEPCAKMCT